MTPEQDLRTCVAATILGGLVTNEKFWLANDNQAKNEGLTTTKVFARDAVKLTDALLEELAL